MQCHHSMRYLVCQGISEEKAIYFCKTAAHNKKHPMLLHGQCRKTGNNIGLMINASENANINLTLETWECHQLYQS